jgi:hypothetical protein
MAPFVSCRCVCSSDNTIFSGAFVGKISATAYGALLGIGFAFVIAIAELPRILEISFTGGKIKFQQGSSPASAVRDEDVGSSSSSSWAAAEPAKTTSMEKRILNTLFVQQVNQWPTMNTLWLFGISGSEEYRTAKQSLLEKGLIGEAKDGMAGEPENKLIYITKKGFNYCIDHYPEISIAGRWWDNEPIDEKNMGKVLQRRISPEDKKGSS